MSKQFNSQWMAEQDDESKNDHNQSSFSYFSGMFNQLSSIQDNVTSQFQDLSNSLPEAGIKLFLYAFFESDFNMCFFTFPGPLSSAFRARVIQAVYLIIAAVCFLILGIVIGIPTIILKPGKFVFW